MAIERKFIAQNLREFRIKEFIAAQLKSVGLSDIKLQRTPLGDKVLVTASRPGLVVGRGGSNIQHLTQELRDNFKLENPQIEIEEVTVIGLDADVIAEMIVNSLERFGSKRFKGVGHRALSDIINAGALGAEILISGKIPSSRSRTWRFYQGYLKKCGDVAVSGINIAYRTAVLKTGVVGVKVSILPPTTVLPDKIVPHEATIEEVDDAETKHEMEEVVEKADDTTDEKADDKKDDTTDDKKAKKNPKDEKKSEEVKAEKKDAKPKESQKATAKKEVKAESEKIGTKNPGKTEEPKTEEPKTEG